jgi:hypothetical protein
MTRLLNGNEKAALQHNALKYRKKIVRLQVEEDYLITSLNRYYAITLYLCVAFIDFFRAITSKASL